MMFMCSLDGKLYRISLQPHGKWDDCPRCASEQEVRRRQVRTTQCHSSPNDHGYARADCGSVRGT